MNKVFKKSNHQIECKQNIFDAQFYQSYLLIIAFNNKSNQTISKATRAGISFWDINKEETTEHIEYPRQGLLWRKSSSYIKSCELSNKHNKLYLKSSDNEIVCLDLINKKWTQWNVKDTASMALTLIISPNQIVINTPNNHLYCFNPSKSGPQRLIHINNNQIQQSKSCLKFCSKQNKLICAKIFIQLKKIEISWCKLLNNQNEIIKNAFWYKYEMNKLPTKLIDKIDNNLLHYSIQVVKNVLLLFISYDDDTIQSDYDMRKRGINMAQKKKHIVSTWCADLSQSEPLQWYQSPTFDIKHFAPQLWPTKTPLINKDNENINFVIFDIDFIKKTEMIYCKICLFDMIPKEILKSQRKAIVPLINGFVTKCEKELLFNHLYVPTMLKHLIVNYYPLWL